jgi:hypothetical protein
MSSSRKFSWAARWLVAVARGLVSGRVTSSGTALGVSEREAPEGGGKVAQFLPPVSGIGADGKVGEDPCDDAVQQRIFAGNVAVQRHHLPVEGLPETAHCQGLGTSVSTICRAAAVMRPVPMPGRLRPAGPAGMRLRALTCRPSGVGAASRFTM